jgi:hypothetical protein
MEPSMKENTDIRYKKVKRIKKNREEKVNEELTDIILTRFIEFRNHDEYTSKEEYVRIQNDDLATKKAYVLF